MMELGDGDLSEAIQVQMWNLLSGIQAFKKEAPLPPPSAMWGHGETGAGFSPKAALHRNLTVPTPWSWTSSLQNHKKVTSGVYKAPGYGLL